MNDLKAVRNLHDRRPLVESALAIDSNWLKRRGYLTPGRSAMLSWTSDGKTVATLEMAASRDILDARETSLTLKTIQAVGSTPEILEQRVRVEWQLCRFGGERAFLRCPCGIRTVKLYYGVGFFECRTCADLAYRTQNMTKWQRAARRARKIHKRLGDEDGYDLLDPAPPDRPTGMRQETYVRLLEDLRQTEMVIEARVSKSLGCGDASEESKVPARHR